MTTDIAPRVRVVTRLVCPRILVPLPGSASALMGGTCVTGGGGGDYSVLCRREVTGGGRAGGELYSVPDLTSQMCTKHAHTPRAAR